MLDNGRHIGNYLIGLISDDGKAHLLFYYDTEDFDKSFILKKAA